MRSVIDLGHALEMELTAEGVEDDHAMALLRDLGCDFAQGYHIAPPMTPEQIDEWAGGGSI